MTDNTLSVDDASTSSRRTRRRSGEGPRKRGALYFLRDLLVIFVVALLVSFLVKTFLIRSFYIPSGSMQNTLQIDDRIIVNQLVPEVVPLSRGDVIVFRDPGGWLDSAPEPERSPVVEAIDWTLGLVGLTSPDNDEHLIKRLIGLPGDHVVCCNTLGQMSVNGVPLDEPYVLLPDASSPVSKDAFDVVVPEDSLWVMGDNRWNSKDSRYNTSTPGGGFVPIDDVVGRAFVVSWPMSHWAWLDDYPSVFDAVPDPADE
ncbi:signal peptidase I [Labedella gwakjiensis]|uniref:Signal peptidase I n=1 Tax=Labedella gwakjiensis TaxID=390269 RepID=A0A2P8H0P0_9MICO|nr:signal peptidase I [Labedella gwakjiensis]PSL39777.1 signal peptidase I [Labedella gwakjiensis]RUQ85843.1 signal peptidase I [Labedella gwakjiensis]